MRCAQNWAGNYHFAAGRFHRPESIDEVRRIVAGAKYIHAVGVRHSFNGAADSPGEMVDLGGIAPDIVIDPERGFVTVGAGTTYGVLAAALQAQGWALHNMASLPHITVGGATATGTHGSGDGNGTLSSAVAGLELVTASGDLIALCRGDAGFDGMVVGLGAFGVVTRLALDIQPSFRLRQDAFADLTWTRLLSNFDAVMCAGYSVSLLTNWSGESVSRLWIKTLQHGDETEDIPLPELGVQPALQAIEGGAAEALDQLTAFGIPGPWSERLAHFQPDREPGPSAQIQSEYMLPRSQAVAVLSRLRAIGERIDRLLYLSEIRTMAADVLWLSPAYGHGAVALHFTWKKEPEAVDAITREIEAMLLPLGSRPHWGKVIHARAGALASAYPMLPAFRELAHSYDPEGKFRNDFLDAHVFG